MTDGRWLPSAIAADGLLNIPYRSCERLKGELEVLEPRTGVTELSECACACVYTRLCLKDDKKTEIFN